MSRLVLEIGNRKIAFHFLLSIFLCALVFAAAASAQEYSQPSNQIQAKVQAQDYSHARIVRLSLVEGDVQIARPEDEGWEQAISNLPLRQGDSLATFRGRAEIEFESGATARLAENTRLQFTELALADGGRITRITLSQGTAVFYANLDKRDVFAVISPGVTVNIPDKARFRMDVRDDHTNVAVTRGDVRVESAAGEYKLSKNDGLVFYVAGRNIQLGRIGEPDEFDRWVNDREDSINTARASSLRSVNAPFRYGLSDLSYHGNWIYVASYGYAWQPTVYDLNWSPYVHGRWVFLRHHGWTWVSYEPWGWVPYHYGRWAHTQFGWVWVPGYFHYWSPAHVVWFRFGRNFGWCPLGPFDRPGPRGVFGRPHHFNQGVVVSTAGGIVQGTRNPGVLRGERAGESDPLPRPPTRGEVFGGRIPGANAADARPANGFAGTRGEVDAPRGGRGGRADLQDGAGRGGEAPSATARTAPAGFAGRPDFADRGDDVDAGRSHSRPVPMSPDTMRNPTPRAVDPNGNVEFDRDERRFVNRPNEGIERDPESRSSGASPANGFSGSYGVPRTAEPRPRSGSPRDVVIPTGSDSSPYVDSQRSGPQPNPDASRTNSNSGYSGRPSQGASPSGYGGARPDASGPRPSQQQSQPQAQPRPSSPSSSTGFGGANRPSSPPAAQPRPNSPPPQSNFQSQPQSHSRPASPSPRSQAPQSRPRPQ